MPVMVIQVYTVMFIDFKIGSNQLQCVVILNASMVVIVNSINQNQREVKRDPESESKLVKSFQLSLKCY